MHDDRIRDLAKEINRDYGHLKQDVLRLRSENPGLILSIPLNRSKLSMTVAAVDGGLLYERVHGADIVVARSAGVIFKYENSKLESFKHFPLKSPPPQIEIGSSFDEFESNVFRSLIRLKSELNCAVSILRKFSPKLLLLDGSLLPLPSDKPADKSRLSGLYAEVISLYENLFAEAGSKGTLLVGVIKDSRSRKLSEGLGFSYCDSLLCTHLLKQLEYTAPQPYSEDKNDPKGLVSKVSCIYMRPSEKDIPLRIEFLNSSSDQASTIASMLCELCSASERFAYPPILIEADMRAALDPREMERINASLCSLTGIMPLRRNSRPFR